MTKIPELVYVVNPNISIAPAVVPPLNIGNIVNLPLGSGGSADLRVNGSVTPVVFSYDADETSDLKLYELRIVMIADNVKFTGDSFGRGTELTNGILISVNNAYGNNPFALVAKNEDMLMFPSRNGILLEQGGQTDMFVCSFGLDGQVTLRGDTADAVTITIQDNLTAPTYGLRFLQCNIYGIKQA